MNPEGQDPLNLTLLAATLGHLMLAVAKDRFPQRSYFDLASPEKQAVAEQVRHLIREARATFGEPGVPSPAGKVDFPPQREEDYL